MSKVASVFNRLTKLKQRQRLAFNKQVEYLRDEVARRTIERVSYISRDFPKLIEYGSNSSNFLTQLTESPSESASIVKAKLDHVYLLDSCSKMLDNVDHNNKISSLGLQIDKINQDEETYQFPERDYFDGAISNLSLHWTNDLPGLFKNINLALKPDGMFMGSLFTTDTLFELRTSLQIAELERLGGVAPHVSPFIRSEDLSNLLKHAGFELVTIDVEEIVVCYPDLLSLMLDLKLMGESSSIAGIENIKLPKDVLISADSVYKTLHGEVDQGNIILPLTFRILFFIGWKKLPNQPKPLERGSADINLKDVLS